MIESSGLESLSSSYERHEPTFAERPGYGIYPCGNEWHRKHSPYGEDLGKCPDCPNPWWASDGTECPDEYAWITEIDVLRNIVAAQS